MELLSNGNPSKRHMENSHRLKYKPRKVSAVRDFPPGCGSNAVLVIADKDSVNRVQKEVKDSLDNLVAKVVASAKSACDVVIELPKGLENNDVEVLKDTNEVEVKGLAENKAVLGGDVHVRVESGAVKKYNLRRISATREFPPFCGRNAPLPTEEDRFRICGKKSLVVGEKGGGGIGVLGETLRACEEGGESRGEAKVGGGDESKEIPLESNKKTPLDDENVKTSESKEAVPELRKRARVEEGIAHKSDSKKIVPEPRKKIHVRDEDVQMSESKESAREPRKKTYAREVNLQKSELKEIVPVIEPRKKAHAQDGDLQKCESKEVMSVPETKKKIHDRDKNEQKNESKEKHDTMERKSNKDVRAPTGKVGKEIVVYSPDKDFRKEKQIMVYSPDKNVRKPSGDGVGLEQELVIVQCLMAAPNCPWKQGRGTVSSPNVSSSRRKVRKSDSDGQEKSKLRASMNSYEANNSVGKKSRSAGKAAYGGVSDLVVRDEEDEAAHTEDQNEDSPAGQRPSEFSVSLPPFGPNSSNQGDARNKVRETLRLFQAICRKLLQGEESKSRQVEESKSNKHLRIDLLAAKIVRDKGKEVNNGKQILGSVPGVEVGDEFQYRVELAIVGIHRLYQAGIDYVKQGKEIVAASIVASGGYNDGLDSADVLVYSGQGGNAIGKDKKAEDQKLERGNLALKNSIAAKNPVRVIRGSKETKASDSSDGKSKVILTTYVYDGLYMVEKYWQEVGVHGKLVFKFELRRIPGQPELAWKELKKSRKFKTREGLCVNDISGGKELFPICAVNTIDDEDPPPFKYITKMIFPDQYLPVLPEGCNCSGVCTDSHICSCAVKNGGEIPYNYNGAIVEAKPLVYECGPSCKCPSSCHNRVSQHGIKIQLEIFKTESRGWGVRSLNSISSGSFICEYIGELLEDKEAEQRTGNDEYLFDIGQNYNDCSLNVQSSSSEVVEDGGFTIDAAQFGNVGRFINHSCSPNLYAQNVLYDNEDKRIPHIMFFAAENIPPLQELTYHYNYTMDQVRDSNGNIRMKNCYCGSTECTGRMY